VRVHPLAPVVGIDIDGTLGDHHRHFVWFINRIYWPHHNVPIEANWRDAEGEFDKALGLEKEPYRAAKLAYRMGGLKRCMPIMKVDLHNGGHTAVRSEIQYIRSQGVQVWICTTRPWLSMTTMDPDTQYWLDDNVGEVDGLIYGEDKYLDLIDIVGKDRILGVVDDLPENITRAQELGLRTAMRIMPHNNYWRGKTAGFHNIRDMSAIVDGWNDK
jgi:hypothetical protein